MEIFLFFEIYVKIQKLLKTLSMNKYFYLAYTRYKG